MRQSFELVMIIALLAVTTILLDCTYAQAAEWSDWYKLEDKALNGIYFSHKKVCPSGNNTSCSLIWRWQNRYEDAVRIDYQITYETSAGTKIKNGQLMLQSGVNESPVFVTNGKTLAGVSVGIIASEQAKAKAREEMARERQKNEERKIQDNEEARRNEERARIAALQQQEHERRRIQEEKRQKEEDKRRDELREEQEQARIAQKQADRDAFNQQLVAGINQLGNTTVNSINSYYGVKNAGIEAENRTREQNRLAQLDAERDHRERERLENLRLERERLERERLRTAKADTELREKGENKDKCHNMTSVVTVKVITPVGILHKDGSTTDSYGYVVVPGEIDVFMANRSSSKLDCSLVPVHNGVQVNKDIRHDSLNPLEDKTDSTGGNRLPNRSAWWGGYSNTDTVKYVCSLDSDEGDCNLKLLGLKR